MTLQEFQNSKVYSDNMQKFDDFDYSDKPTKGYFYLGDHNLFIQYLDKTQEWYLILGNEDAASKNLEDLEIVLHDWYVKYIKPDICKEIVQRWITLLGRGFHPDTRADDYTPELLPFLKKEYEKDMDYLFKHCDDPYALAAQEIDKDLKKFDH